MAYTRETEDDDWDGSIDILGNTYPLSLRASYEQEELDDVASRAKHFLEANWQRILGRLAADLLPMHNDQWSDEDAPPLSEAEFLQRIGAPDVNVWEEDAMMLYFSADGLFSGHYIEVFIDGPEEGREISVGIIG